ncbi:MAG: Cytotoxic [uncultured Campylobacterales bacterium]|uniref:Cytotoxic n=1 Tax=uncultured Campylobacterales bacterium TaxID=352960 RepID=A0A6S6S8W1_9BACT|nr:MAG: Cytotoxic [uncultured Campylobacterales bacterium]
MKKLILFIIFSLILLATNLNTSQNLDSQSFLMRYSIRDFVPYFDYSKDKDIDKTSEYKDNRDNYAHLIGDATLDYTNFNYTSNGYNALDEVINRQIGSKASDLIAQNNFEFNALDKTKGDPLLFLTSFISLTGNANAPDINDVTTNDYPFIDANILFSGIATIVDGNGIEVLTQFGMLKLGSKLLKPLEDKLGQGIDYLKSKLGFDEKLVVGADGKYYAIKKSDFDDTVSDINNGNIVKIEGNGKTPDYIKDNRKLIDSDTVLVDKTKYTKIGRTGPKGSQIYKDKNGNYYHRDTLHVGKGAELEVYDKSGKHIGTADPLTGILDTTKKVAGRNIKKYL